jgi:hypothetical protein
VSISFAEEPQRGRCTACGGKDHGRSCWLLRNLKFSPPGERALQGTLHPPPIPHKHCRPKVRSDMSPTCAQRFASSVTEGRLGKGRSGRGGAGQKSGAKLWIPHAEQKQRLMGFPHGCSQGPSVSQGPQCSQEPHMSTSGPFSSILGQGCYAHCKVRMYSSHR